MLTLIPDLPAGMTGSQLFLVRAPVTPAATAQMTALNAGGLSVSQPLAASLKDVVLEKPVYFAGAALLGAALGYGLAKLLRR